MSHSVSPGPADRISIQLDVVVVQSDIVFLDAILSFGEFNLLVFDDEVNANDTACHLTAVLAVADVTSTLLAEEVVVIDLDSHSFAKTCSFHCQGLRLKAGLLSSTVRGSKGGNIYIYN